MQRQQTLHQRDHFVVAGGVRRVVEVDGADGERMAAADDLCDPGNL
ncbi:MAG: hypothetical protein IMY75_12510 [Chloroflexi bacterium]|nr:hypothetical protein [Chloroflexota bacterium]